MNSRTVGGSIGHIHEDISGPILQLYLAYRWKMLPNCTGRYTCLDHKSVSVLTPTELVKDMDRCVPMTTTRALFMR
ncbi:hypothetical protein SARC_08900 [Sphaeroforma arctica JP610]|uniref:Uncharacterized protein n=1 Tax=Sphaeroforma arctica JP610 TaxID=667725 RepID=A0A0L0FPD4_9EUKA|nr:hypothetical protein SARC_08900 [Sphaeroforma arctica JP610]KNC78675.1 hypothetical protein SARC_08900 [Sphaeroforma arctica JP610]|eukprot:XP_014152577.1 hypothetical protein SARC_08900 [Sphaeroforma arctica JP610]